MIHTMQRDHPKGIGLLRRMAAFVYDALLLFGVLILASLVIVIPFDITYGGPLYPLYILYIYLVALLYLGWFWTHTGQTLGMKTWHIRVQGLHGGRVGWRAAILRFMAALLFWVPAAGIYYWSRADLGLLSILGLLPLLVDYLWCYRHPERLALHDILSATRLAWDTESQQGDKKGTA
jgi:uncharacterized RDD family membrane protein YckC